MPSGPHSTALHQTPWTWFSDTAFRRAGIAKTPQSGRWHPEPGPFPDRLPLRAPGEEQYSQACGAEGLLAGAVCSPSPVTSPCMTRERCLGQPQPNKAVAPPRSRLWSQGPGSLWSRVLHPFQGPAPGEMCAEGCLTTGLRVFSQMTERLLVRAETNTRIPTCPLQDGMSSLQKMPFYPGSAGQDVLPG